MKTTQKPSLFLSVALAACLLQPMTSGALGASPPAAPDGLSEVQQPDDTRGTEEHFEETTGEVDEAAAEEAFQEPGNFLPLPLEIISDFEASEGLHTEFGFGWRTSTDSMRGGDSTVTMERIDGGAQQSRGALEVSGEIRRGSTSTWAGAKLFLGDNPTQPVDLSDTTELVFWARGDGGSYRISLFTKSRGSSKTWITFEPGLSWTEYSLPWAEFEGADPREITAVMFSAGPDIRPFLFQLDLVAIR
ncbi:MAG: CIA30 family protein [Deltaproteobacteria bacterium]|nr:CIA30 family protein [Deltaproteobacteria bacterium]